MERNERGLSDKQKRAAKILFSVLAFIVIGVCITLLFSPGRIWDKYADFVKILLILAWLISALFIILLVDSRDEKRFFKKKLIGWQLAYGAEAIYMFLVSGWWKEENINNIFDKEVFRSIGIGTEGYLRGKILLLIFAAIVVWIILLGINYALGRFVDEFDESGTGNIITAVMNKVKANENKADAGNGNGDKSKKDSNGGKGKDGTTDGDGKAKLERKHWLALGIVGFILLVFTLIALPKVSKIIETVVPKKEISNILKTILEISKLMISFLVAVIEAVVVMPLVGFVTKTAIYVWKNFKKWINGDCQLPRGWFTNILGWAISIVIVYYIADKPDTFKGVIDGFKGQLSGNEFVDSFIAAIMLIAVMGFLKIITTSIISVILEGYNPDNDGKKDHKDRLKSIINTLITNALDLIENTVELTKIIPNFILQASDLIRSEEHNSDELEGIIVKSKKIQVKEEKKSCDSVQGDYAKILADFKIGMYEEYLKSIEKDKAADTNTGDKDKPNTTTDDTEEK